MKIALISSWLPRQCGIAVYSNDLAKALKKIGVNLDIFCHTDGGRTNESHIHPVIDMRRTDWQDVLYHAVELVGPDVIHIQHEYGLYTLKKDLFFDFAPANSFKLADALFRWQTSRRPTVVTYHSVYSKMTFEEVMYYKYFSSLATANIVHENYQKEALTNYLQSYQSNNIFSVPHGTWSDPNINKEKTKLANGWEDKLVVGMFGFLEHTKGFARIIKLWPKVVAQVPNALLVIEGNVRPGSPTGSSSLAEIANAIENCPAKKNISFVRKYFEWEENNNFISGFDLLVLPYLFASQSGNLAHGYSVGLPVIASDLEGIASSLKNSRAGFLAKTDNDFLDRIIFLLKNPKKRTDFAKNSLSYGKKTDWVVTAKKHLEIYDWAILQQKLSLKSKKYIDKRVHV